MPETAQLVCDIQDGLMPSENIVRLATADGHIEEVLVANTHIHQGKLRAFVIGKSEDRVLVELPRESASGRWRIWMRESEVGF